MRKEIIIPHFDFNRLKEIPIVEVASALGIEVKQKNGGAWCKLRNEKTASCKLYETTNTFCDFGDGNRGGDTIDFVAAARGIDITSASEVLANMFGIEADNLKTPPENQELSFIQYEKIGIAGELATMNFDFDIDKYGVERTRAFSEKYRMSVNELKKQYPKVYENMLRVKAVPFVYEKRQEYYRSLWNNDMFYKSMGVDYSKNHELTGEMRLKALERNRENKLLCQAIKGTELKYKSVTCEVEEDIKKIRSGAIQFEVGNVMYASMKHTNKALSYKEVSAETYLKQVNGLNNVEHAAFVKGDKVNMAFKPEDKQLVENVFNVRTQNKALK